MKIATSTTGNRRLAGSGSDTDGAAPIAIGIEHVAALHYLDAAGFREFPRQLSPPTARAASEGQMLLLGPR